MHCAVIPGRLWNDLEEYAAPFAEVTSEALKQWADEKQYSIPIGILLALFPLFLTEFSASSYSKPTPFQVCSELVYVECAL